MGPAQCASLPLPAQNYDAGNFRAQRSAHAGLLLCWMSPEVDAAFPTEAQALFAGFQELFQRDVTAEDVRRYPTVGRGAYTTDEADWCNATYDFLDEKLDEVAPALRCTRFLAGRLCLARCTSLSCFSRKSYVVLHHSASLAVYAPQPTVG